MSEQMDIGTPTYHRLCNELGDLKGEGFNVATADAIRDLIREEIDSAAQASPSPPPVSVPQGPTPEPVAEDGAGAGENTTNAIERDPTPGEAVLSIFAAMRAEFLHDPDHDNDTINWALGLVDEYTGYAEETVKKALPQPTPATADEIEGRIQAAVKERYPDVSKEAPCRMASQEASREHDRKWLRRHFSSLSSPPPSARFREDARLETLRRLAGLANTAGGPQGCVEIHDDASWFVSSFTGNVRKQGPDIESLAAAIDAARRILAEPAPEPQGDCREATEEMRRKARKQAENRFNKAVDDYTSGGTNPDGVKTLDQLTEEELLSLSAAPQREPDLAIPGPETATGQAIRLLLERDEAGIKTYGRRLMVGEPGVGREPGLMPVATDISQEAGDLLVYVMQLIGMIQRLEQDKREPDLGDVAEAAREKWGDRILSIQHWPNARPGASTIRIEFLDPIKTILAMSPAEAIAKIEKGGE